MRLKLISDGTPKGSRVVDAATGELVRGITRIELVITPTGNEATVHLVNVVVDVAYRMRVIRHALRRRRIVGLSRI